MVFGYSYLIYNPNDFSSLMEIRRPTGSQLVRVVSINTAEEVGKFHYIVGT